MGFESNHEKRERITRSGQNPLEAKSDAIQEVEGRIVKAVGIRFFCSRAAGGSPPPFVNRKSNCPSGRKVGFGSWENGFFGEWGRWERANDRRLGLPVVACSRH